MPSIGSLGGSKGFGKVQYSPGVVPIVDAATTTTVGTTRTSTVTETSAYGSAVGNGLNAGITFSAFDPLGRGPVTVSLGSGTLPPGFAFANANGTQSVSGSYTIGGWNADGLTYTFGLSASDQGPSPQSVTQNYNIQLSVPFRYRQVITRGFVQGGYRNGYPWKNVTKVNHSDGAYTNKGDLLQTAGSYTKGAVGKDYAYLFACSDTHPGTTQTTSSWNVRNEATRTITGTSLNMAYSRNDMGVCWEEHKNAYLVGGGSDNVEKFDLVNEVYITQSGQTYFRTGGGAGDTNYQYAVGHVSHSDRGFWWFQGNDGRKIAYSTGTVTSQTGITAGDNVGGGQQKGMSSKNDKGYGSNAGSYNAVAGTAYKRFQFSSDSTISGTCAKIYPTMGEENNDMGQNVCYSLGNYEGPAGSGQNLNVAKMTYSTDTQVTATALPTFYSAGVPADAMGTGVAANTATGRSSAGTAWCD